MAAMTKRPAAYHISTEALSIEPYGIVVRRNDPEFKRLGDEVIYLHQGRVVERAPVETFFAQPATAEAAAFIKGELPWD